MRFAFANALALTLGVTVAAGCRTDPPSAAGPAAVAPASPSASATRARIEQAARALTGELHYAETHHGTHQLRSTGPLGGPARKVPGASTGMVPVPGTASLAIRAGTKDDPAEQLVVLDRGEARSLGSAAGRVRHPTMDPSGRFVVYASSKHSFRDIYRADVASGKEQRLTRDGDGAFEPTLSPDGRRIAFVTTKPGQSDIHVMDATGTNREPLVATPAHETGPAWSPDGTFLAFTSDVAGPERVFVVPERGGTPQRLTDAADPNQHEIHPVWSPTGRYVAYLVHAANGTSELWVAEWPSGKRTRVSRAAGHAAYATWSPTGSLLWYSDRGTASLDLWAVRPDGTGRVQVTNGPGDEWLPQWRAK